MKSSKISAIGSSWEDARKEIFTPAENEASDLSVLKMIKMLRASIKRGWCQHKKPKGKVVPAKKFCGE